MRGIISKNFTCKDNHEHEKKFPIILTLQCTMSSNVHLKCGKKGEEFDHHPNFVSDNFFNRCVFMVTISWKLQAFMYRFCSK